MVKRAEPIDIKEEMLWSSGILGDSEPQSLLDTIIFVWLLFGPEEWPGTPQICLEIIERDGGMVLRYTEDVSKNNPSGLKHCKIEPKIIEHCANAMNPERRRSKYYEKYVLRCPPISERKSNSFYLTPLKKPKNDVWYSTVPVGHNTLGKTVSHLCSMAGIQGHTTNHSLRVTATILFQQGWTSN